MESQILPVSIPPSPASTPAASASVAAVAAASAGSSMLVKGHSDQGARLAVSFEDNDEIRPFLARFSSCLRDGAASGNHRQKRRRRLPGEASVLPSSASPGAGGGLSFQRDVSHAAAAESFNRLTSKMLRYLGGGCNWMMKFLAIGCYAVLLMPGFVQVGYYYYFSSQVRRDIAFGDHPRHKLDLYLPKKSDGRKPVVAFVTGGAWVIGYRAWGCLLGQQLSESDIIVACIDYRNFPKGTISDMVKDASQGISFICNNIAEYGGDPNRIFLMGQSAGAHIAACTLLEQAIQEAGEGESTTWSVSQIKAYFGLSGGYNLYNLVEHFYSRGVSRSFILSIMEGEQSLRRFSPEVMVQDPNLRAAVSLLPPITLFHGTGDYSIPSDASKSFAEALQRVGVEAKSILYEGKTHTDLFVQDPMRGGQDEMFEDLVTAILADESGAPAKDVVAHHRRRLVPELLLMLARIVSPF